MLDYGNAEFDVRHRFMMSAIWNLPFFVNSTGVTRTLLGGWQVNWIFSARTGFPFTLWDCTSGVYYCMRAIDPVGISTTANGNTATGNPNEYTLLDLSKLMPTAGSYTNPKTDTSDYGPYPSNMTKRDAFRGPGFWNVDFAFSKRFRFGTNYAAQIRIEVVQRVQPREHVRQRRQRGYQQLRHDHRVQGRQPPYPARIQVRVLIWKDRCQASNSTTFCFLRGGHHHGARPVVFVSVPFC